MKPTPTAEMIEAYAEARALEAMEVFGCYDRDNNRHYIVSDSTEVWSLVDENYNRAHEKMMSELDRRRAEFVLSAALSVPAAAVVGEPEWWIVTTDMGKVIFHGPDKDRADRVAAMHGREAQPLYAAPPAPDGWQPIETAPKTGEIFIAWDGKYAFRCCAGKHYVKWPHEVAGPTYRDVWNGIYYDSIVPENPILWCPLPAPPALGGKP